MEKFVEVEWNYPYRLLGAKARVNRVSWIYKRPPSGAFGFFFLIFFFFAGFKLDKINSFCQLGGLNFGTTSFLSLSLPWLITNFINIIYYYSYIF